MRQRCLRNEQQLSSLALPPPPPPTPKPAATKRTGLMCAYLFFDFLFQAVRLQKVNSYISAVHELSEILSFDFSKALSNVHKSLTGASKSISNDTLARLTELVESLRKEKRQRLLKVSKERILSQLFGKLVGIDTFERFLFISATRFGKKHARALEPDGNTYG